VVKNLAIGREPGRSIRRRRVVVVEPHLEIHDERFDIDGPDSIVTICAPVKS
jgi:hypothetical protein